MVAIRTVSIDWCIWKCVAIEQQCIATPFVIENMKIEQENYTTLFCLREYFLNGDYVSMMNGRTCWMIVCTV